MNAIVVTWRELLVALVVVLAVYAAEMLLLLRGLRARRADTAPREAPPAAGPATPTTEPPFAALALRGEIDTLRGEVAQLRAELAALTAPGAATSELAPYAQAIHLARDGKAAAQLVETCGISRAPPPPLSAPRRRR
ncbi:MAG: DUF2802 domain-containing protein [Burkholderiales bacterium]|nr:DUF2802 domain-containing protein [Burkholderiales bacterium]